jgi:transposase InsO family protein
MEKGCADSTSPVAYPTAQIPQKRFLAGQSSKQHLAGSLPYYIKDYASPREAREGLRGYLCFYNEHRLHQALDYHTPAEVYFEN